MVQDEKGLGSRCICPECFTVCSACMGTRQAPMEPDQLRFMLLQRERMTRSMSWTTKRNRMQKKEKAMKPSLCCFGVYGTGVSSGTGVSGTAVGTGVNVTDGAGVLVDEDGALVVPDVGVASTKHVQVSP